MFSRQDAKHAKKSIARFRPTTERGILWFMDDDLVFDKEVAPKALFIPQPGARGRLPDESVRRCRCSAFPSRCPSSFAFDLALFACGR